MRRVGWRIADLRGSRLSSLARFARQQVCGFDARVWPTCGVNLLDWARISPEVEVVAGCVVSLIALAASSRAPSAVDELWNALNDLPKSPIFVEVDVVALERLHEILGLGRPRSSNANCSTAAASRRRSKPAWRSSNHRGLVQSPSPSPRPRLPFTDQLRKIHPTHNLAASPIPSTETGQLQFRRRLKEAEERDDTRTR